MQKVIIESAIKLDSKQLEAIEAILKKRVSGKFSFENTVNPEILGGIRVTIGSKRIDLSLKGKLEQVKKQLA
ncbi:hypothetical protein C5B42_05460 [Candidatus Cerribacteria bacterium 'Amazon FNV 2010 28 9']|uniref:Uncharacterized protein n=1 Tax=Candidatus Cerribacteria bacterium 'Amazon FNV 2010 28 9' TaxID=2081795 RepID=A0A317JM24_9BACT|nr:MAG: hypothetical protein C5B42_05460 [Candidatus Cerribacteria bacterium 'Amazon FNV 2010 28 9']